MVGTAGIAGARATAREAARATLGEERADDVALVVSELVTNALEHGSGGEVEIVIRRFPDHLEVSVSSPSNALPVPRPHPAPVHEACGRGLPIVAALSDSVVIRGEHDSVLVTCRFGSAGARTRGS